jgi:acyl-ACP thioesterase
LNNKVFLKKIIMLKNPSSTYQFSINSYDADSKGRMPLYKLFHYLQEAAYLNAESNGFGYEFLEKEKAYWVLVRVMVRIDQYPRWNDEIAIKTWPRGAHGLFAVRDFEISQGNKVIGSVSTYWMILDKDSRRPKPIHDYAFVKSDFLKDRAIHKDLDKILIEGESQLVDQRKVYSSDIDVNAHVNNATYIKWVMDAYYEKNDGQVKEIEVNFIGELFPGEQFSIEESILPAKHYYMIKNNKGRAVTRVRVLF